MQEITKLKITQQQLAEKHFYYNGCEVSSADIDEDNDEILNLVADVLIDILAEEYKEN